MIDLINRAKNILEGVENIAIFPFGFDDKESYHCAMALYYSLRKLGKNAKIIDTSNYSQDDLQESDSKTFSITINTKGKEIDEIFYDKQDDYIRLDFVMPKGSEMEEGDVIISSKNKNEFDAIITIGVPRLSDLGDALEQNFKLFYEKPIINIDNDFSNEKFGQVNLLKKTALAKIAILLMNSFSKDLKKEKEILSALRESALGADFQSFDGEQIDEIQKMIDYLQRKIQETEQEQSPAPRQEQEKIIKEDIPEKIEEQEKNNEEDNSIIKKLKLFNKAIESLELVNKAYMPTMILKKNDFISSGADIKELGLVIKELKDNPVYKFPRFLLIWEEDLNSSLCGAVLYSNMAEQIKTLSKFFSGQSKENAFLFYSKNKSAESLKQEIINLLWKK